MELEAVVLPAAAFRQALGLGNYGDQFGIKASSHNRLLSKLAKPFCNGDRAWI